MAGCAMQGGCDDGHCIIFSDAPPDEGAYCDPLPPNAATRATGTVRSLSTQVAAAGASVAIAPALQAVTNPSGAMPILFDTTDGAGEFDVTSAGPVESAIGLIALAQLDGFYLTGTTTAEPLEGNVYPPSNDVHDLWLVNNADLDQWSALMQSDVEAAPYLPLGNLGGVVGLVRDPNGTPMSGVTVTPVRRLSQAVVRYVAGADVVDSETAASGIFIIVNPGLAEEFTVQGPSGSATIVALSAEGLVFAVAPVLP